MTSLYKGFLLMICCTSVAVALDFVDETLLLSCQGVGHALYSNCVAKPPILSDDLAKCTALKANYLLCLSALSVPYGLSKSGDPDPYALNPFTPCYFETAHLILFDICPSTSLPLPTK